MSGIETSSRDGIEQDRQQPSGLHPRVLSEVFGSGTDLIAPATPDTRPASPTFENPSEQTTDYESLLLHDVYGSFEEEQPATYGAEPQTQDYSTYPASPVSETNPEYTYLTSTVEDEFEYRPVSRQGVRTDIREVARQVVGQFTDPRLQDPRYFQPQPDPRLADGRYQEVSYQDRRYRPDPRFEDPRYRPDPRYQDTRYGYDPRYQDPRYGYDPRYQDPRYGYDPRYQDPRYGYDPRYQDPRYGYDPRYQDPRYGYDPRYQDPRYGYDPRYQDPRRGYDPRFQDPRYGYDPRFQDPRYGYDPRFGGRYQDPRYGRSCDTGNGNVGRVIAQVATAYALNEIARRNGGGCFGGYGGYRGYGGGYGGWNRGYYGNAGNVGVIIRQFSGNRGRCR